MSDDLWTVVHQSPMPNGSDYYGTAYGPSESREGAENQLAYCQMRAERGDRGFEGGRYFLARVVEEVQQ